LSGSKLKSGASKPSNVIADYCTDLQISKFQSILIKAGLSSINLQ